MSMVRVELLQRVHKHFFGYKSIAAMVPMGLYFNVYVETESKTYC